MRGPLVDRSGRVRTGTVRERDLYAALAASDLDPYLRAGAARRDRLARRRRRRPAAAPGGGAPAGEGDADAINTRPAAGHVLHRGAPAVGARLADREPRRRARRVRRRARRELRALQRGDGDASSALTALCADWPPTPRPESRALRRPERPRARALRPRRPAHAARGRPPHGRAVPGRPGARGPRRRPLRADLGHQRLRARRHGRVPARPAGREVLADVARGARPVARRAVRAGHARRAAPDRARRRSPAARSAPSRSRSPASGSTSPPRRRTARRATRACAAATSAAAAARSSSSDAEWIRGVRVSGRLDDNGRGTLTRDRPGERDDHLHPRRRPRRASAGARLHYPALKATDPLRE